MGAVFDDCNAKPRGQRHQRGHIRAMPAHMRQQQVLGPARRSLCFEISKIDGQVWRDLNQHVLGACVRDGSWNGRQRESIHQNFVTGFDARTNQRQEHRAAARVGGDAICRSDQVGEVVFQQRDVRGIAERFTVAMQPACPQKLVDPGGARLRDPWRLREIHLDADLAADLDWIVRHRLTPRQRQCPGPATDRR
jgi:hypothetical protein